MDFIIGTKKITIPDEEVKKNLEEKKEITMPGELVVREKTEEETFVSNITEQAKKGVANAALEMAVKDARTKLGLEFTGKSLDNLLTAYEEKVKKEASEAPEEKYTKLEVQYKELKEQNTNLVEKEKTYQKQYSDLQSTYEINGLLDGLMPEKIVIPKEDMKMVLKSKISFEKDETSGAFVAKQNGEVMKNPVTHAPLTPQDVVKTFFDTNPTYLQGAQGGAGGGDTGGGGKMKLSSFMKEQGEKGITPGTQEFVEALTALGDNVDMDN